MYSLNKNIIIFFIFCTIFSCAKDKLIEEVKEFFPNGKPKLKIFYIEINGKKEIVKDQYFYNNGQLYGEVNYRGGTKNGKFRQYFKNGLLESEGFYKNGNRNEWTTFEYDETNQKTAEEKFDEFGDRLSRKSFVYYDNGNLKSEEFYVNGQKVINWIYYANNGKKESSGATKRGKKHGEWKYFLSDLSYKSGFYQNNKRTEEWEYFSKNGQNYNFISYYANNRISELGRIEDDKKNGIWTKYYDNGQLEFKGSFLDDQKRPTEIFPTPNCAAIVFRGMKWPTDCANKLVHRSPEINDVNETRLLFVIDPVDNSDE